ncbi:MAG TPA: hypothetical protein VGD53_32390 [Actinoallomurus sp.]|jgi:peptide/nickel transport system permease protein
MPLCGPAAVSVKTWSHKLRFLIRRILSGALVLWAVATAVFVLSFVTSRDPAARFAGKSATPATLALLRHSYATRSSVSGLIGGALPATVSLAVGGVVLWTLTGLLAGVLSAACSP